MADFKPGFLGRARKQRLDDAIDAMSNGDAADGSSDQTDRNKKLKAADDAANGGKVTRRATRRIK